MRVGGSVIDANEQFSCFLIQFSPELDTHRTINHGHLLSFYVCFKNGGPTGSRAKKLYFFPCISINSRPSTIFGYK